MMKPILKYPGAKWSAASWILENLPEHEIYLEPFFGSGAVFFNKWPVRVETINDMDGNVVNLFRVIRDYPDELAELIYLTPWSREEYLSSYTESDNDIEKARRFMVRCWQAFGTLTGCKTGWRHSVAGSSPRMPEQWSKVPDRVYAVAERLKGAQIECMEAVKLIQKYNDSRCLVYADPPYMPETRRKGIYAVEMDERQHEVLLGVLEDHKGSVVLSGYDNQLYNDRLKGWQRIEKKSSVERGQSRIEVMWIKGVERC